MVHSSYQYKEETMPNYVLLLRGGEYQGYSPEEMQKILEKYINWIGRLRSEGRHNASAELNKTGRVLRWKENRIVDAPFTETKEAVGGFFMIEAKDYDEAVSISRGCPHLEFQGEIEVREVIPH